MRKQKASKQSEKGALTKFQTNFLYMSEAERRKRYGYDVNQYYGRIIGSINKSFHDIQIALKYLPKKYREQINVELGLRTTQKIAIKVGHSEGKPHLIIENTIDNLKDCLKILKNESGAKIRDIAERDFDKVEVWLKTLHRYPETH